MFLRTLGAQGGAAPKPQIMEITYVGSKKKSEIGRPLNLSVSRPQLLVDIQPDPSLESAWTERLFPTVAVQTRPTMSEHSVNTQSAPLVDHGMLHTEGGWPEGVDITDEEHRARFRKKVERSDGYIQALSRLASLLPPILELNNAVDSSASYFSSPGIFGSSQEAAPSAAIISQLRDPVSHPRWARSISWCTDGRDQTIAVAYCSLDLERSLHDTSLSIVNPPIQSSYIWDISVQATPEFELKVPGSPLTSIEFMEKDSHLLAAATYSGLVLLYDTRVGNRPVAASPPDVAHRDVVTTLVSLKSKNGTEVMTGSIDGVVKTWNLKEMDKPMDEVVVHSQPPAAQTASSTAMATTPSDGVTPLDAGLAVMDPESLYGVTSLSFDAQAGVTRFIAGTEQGFVCNCNRKGQNPFDRMLQQQSAHSGPVDAVVRSPFFPRTYLTAGSWTCALWHDDARGFPLMQSSFGAYRYTSVDWSPVRMGIFAVTDAGGHVYFWDLLQSLTQPVLTTTVGDAPLCCCRWASNGKHLAVGAADGSVSIIECGIYFQQCATDEKTRVSQLIERELNRTKYLISYAVGQQKDSGTRPDVELTSDQMAEMDKIVGELWGDVCQGAEPDEVAEPPDEEDAAVEADVPQEEQEQPQEEEEAAQDEEVEENQEQEQVENQEE